MIPTRELSSPHTNKCRQERATLWTSTSLSGSKALVIIPGSVNYFYNVEGKRLAEALRNLGSQVDVCTLETYVNQPYDWCFLLNIYEIDFAYGNRAAFLREMRKLKNICGLVLPTLLESVQTQWFDHSYELMLEADLDKILDMGIEDQSHQLSGYAKGAYGFLFNGLTDGEQSKGKAMLSPQEKRTLPWTFVGHTTAQRLSLLERLVLDYDPAGFVYLINHVPYTEDGPHLKEDQLELVLKRTRYKIWCSHHKYNYLESVRFRLAFLCGCVPIKINLPSQVINKDAPFSSLILEEDNFVEHIKSLVFKNARQSFVDEFCALPSLEASILELLTRWSLTID